MDGSRFPGIDIYNGAKGSVVMYLTEFDPGASYV